LFTFDANVEETKECITPRSDNTQAIYPTKQIVSFTTAFDARASCWVKTFILPWALGYCTEAWVIVDQAVLVDRRRATTVPWWGDAWCDVWCLSLCPRTSTWVST